MVNSERILAIKEVIYNDSKIQEDIGVAISKNTKGTMGSIYSDSDGYHFTLRDNKSKALNDDIFSAICDVMGSKCDDISTVEPRKLFNVLPINDSKDFTIII